MKRLVTFFLTCLLFGGALLVSDQAKATARDPYTDARDRDRAACDAAYARMLQLADFVYQFCVQQCDSDRLEGNVSESCISSCEEVRTLMNEYAEERKKKCYEDADKAFIDAVLAETGIYVGPGA